jgi:hypothetical protein
MDIIYLAKIYGIALPRHVALADVYIYSIQPFS